ncbi:MAG: FtsW/RodA/SpoVE family cell cycle protein [Bacilli bacterium]|nr:FtsW/RodA/SpoVE family cell cycle protein [Bacilli bacterium]
MKAMIKKINLYIADMDKPFLIITSIFFIFGLLNIVTASSREAVSNDVTLYYYFYRHLIMLMIGLVGSIIIIVLPTKKYYYLGFIAFIVLLAVQVFLLLFGSGHRGAINWIKIAGITFQPSELSKPIMIVCLSLLFEKYYHFLKDKKVNHYNVIGFILFIGCAIPAIVFLQKDFGTMLIMIVTFGTLFITGPILRIDKIRTIILVIVLATLSLLIISFKQGYLLTEAQLSRFDFINPCSNYENGGYQICNGFIAINDGGLLGLGIGKSKQKYSYIPEPHTDSVFAIITEEYGLLKVIPIFIGYLFVLYRITKIASKTSSIRGRYICLGVSTYIFMHIFINLGGLFGLIPLTGVPLPFLSYGGSFTIALMASLALVQRVNIEMVNKKIKIVKGKAY